MYRRIEIIKKYAHLNSYQLFVINCTIYFISLWIEFRYIFTDYFYNSNLLKSLHTETQIFDYVTKDRGLEWKNYAFIPFMIFLIVILITICLFIGFNTIEEKVSFKDSFKISLQSFIVFPLNYFVTVLLKVTHVINYNFENVNDAYKYQSLLHFFNVDKLPQWAIYPLEKVNITEFLYLLVLALFINLHLKFKWSKSIKFSLVFYGIGLLVWIVFSVFIKIVFFS
jgi:hypothetical protein